jgi:glycosyltransferase involved in cell wall biosynthesis
MRICLISPFPPARDGIGDHAAVVATALEARGHDVRVVAVRPAYEAPPRVVASLPVRRAARDRLLAALRAWRPDVVQVEFGVAAYGTRLPALLRLLPGLHTLGARVVIGFHEVTRDTGLLRGPGRALYRRVARFADVAVVHSEPAATALEGEVGAAAPVRVIPLPRAEPPPASTRPDTLIARHGLGGRRVLLACGFIHVDQGLVDLARALALLRSRAAAQDVHLVVAGDVRRRHGAFRVFELVDRLHLLQVRALVRRHGLRDRVTFAGYVPTGEVRAWFELAECAVLPYRRSDQSAVAPIAAAVGTPVLATTVGGLTELGDAGAGVVPPRSPDGLADALGAFLGGRSGAVPRPPLAPDGVGEFRDRLLEVYARVSAGAQAEEARVGA